jgi:hypothetical protein
MSARKIRRAAEHAARKAARKAGFPVTAPSSPAVVPSTPTPTESELAAAIADETPEAILLADIPEPGFPFPALSSISPARLAANQANAKLSKGALTPETKAISAQNHTVHGLARHQPGNFKLLTSENSASFEALRQALTAEHEPSTETECILVNRMIESHWLENRAQRLQDLCMDPDTGAVTDEKKFSLYMRYKTTQTRAFHKCLNDLLKLRAGKRKAELGVEAQRVQTEKQEMKKQRHYWETLKADAEACRQLGELARENRQARMQDPGFEAEYAAELEKRGLKKNSWEAARTAA